MFLFCVNGKIELSDDVYSTKYTFNADVLNRTTSPLNDRVLYCSTATLPLEVHNSSEIFVFF